MFWEDEGSNEEVLAALGPAHPAGPDLARMTLPPIRAEQHAAKV